MSQLQHNSSAADVRQACRTGEFRGPTCGLAAGFAQANLVILPAELAAEFHEFCRLNRQACPLLAVSEPGAIDVPALAMATDVRTDLPRYRIWRDGQLDTEVSDIRNLWQEDFVCFYIGCSFTFEEALQAAGIPLRHWELGCNVPMFRTNRPCVASGPFSGELVVSMRPLTPEHAIAATLLTANFPDSHGPPVHWGHPQALGIVEISQPDFGDAVPTRDDEYPVFWACGVTPQVALMNARVPLAITHAPGCMFVTDRRSVPD